ncbi:hypothetical protein SAMN05428959_102108 [Duganella sp. CF517]|uniref:hypothetical protein n=1 Tax=Duganella sp. CF517 TaxID=1881038 RepID=UPI0008BE6BC9|nr:hypothetical protein [Duganella sp. CF517]SEN49090.1 hypothetical protein SAMN05428959_102108 [Duganella sp. CF517]
MKSLKPAALAAAFLLGSLLCANAWGESAPAGTPAQPRSQPQSQAGKDAYAKLPVCELSEDGKRLAVEPCRTAPAAAPMPRRPVPLTILQMPNNKVAPQVAMPKTQPSTPIEALMQPPGTPIPAVGCTAGGCYDPGGARHNAGPGSTTITPAGKLCQRQGAWLQC